MLFGDIVEPSTRAFCDEDPQYLENYGCSLEWSVTSVPDSINNLFIAESTRVTTLFQKCVIQNTSKYSELTPGSLCIYQASTKDDYVVICNPSDVIPGLIVEKLVQWLKLAKRIFIITSGLITLLQNTMENSLCVIRSLHHKVKSTHPKLEVPNMVTGLSASIFSYCVHIDCPCSLYIGFFDEVPLDSLNTHTLLTLLEKLGLCLVKRYKFESSNQSSNLYV